MKQLEGLLSFLGKPVTLFTTSYIYTGRLVAANDTFVKLNEPYIVYETGPLMAKTWKDAQPLLGPWYVQLAQLESFGPGKGE